MNVGSGVCTVVASYEVFGFVDVIWLDVWWQTPIDDDDEDDLDEQ